MDPAQLTVAALAFTGACIAQKCADAGLEVAWSRIVEAYRTWRGTEPSPIDIELGGRAHDEVDSGVIAEAQGIFELSSALRRARLVADIAAGANILWIDDQPENNAWERSLLKAFRIHVTTVETTRSAVAALSQEKFDVVVSDISRDHGIDEGLTAMPRIKDAAGGTPIVFYVAALKAGVPPGAFGITNDPNELLHLILDALERHRV